jgi:response regulator NasT
MEQVLIVASSDKSVKFFESFLREGFTQDYTIAASGSVARRMLSERDFDVVIINAPLSDEQGVDLAIAFHEDSSAGVVLIIKNEYEEEISEQLSEYGIVTVSKPIQKLILTQAIRMAHALHIRIVGYRSKNLTLEMKIEEIRIVDKAKYALIQYLHMTENEAHRYIEKQAMDKRKTKLEISREILERFRDD